MQGTCILAPSWHKASALPKSMDCKNIRMSALLRVESEIGAKATSPFCCDLRLSTQEQPFVTSRVEDATHTPHLPASRPRTTGCKITVKLSKIRNGVDTSWNDTLDKTTPGKTCTQHAHPEPCPQVLRTTQAHIVDTDLKVYTNHNTHINEYLYEKHDKIHRT